MAELDNRKQNLKDLVEAKKIQQSDEFGGAGTVETNYVEIKPVTLKEKWDNYWYHYKIATLVGIVIIIVLVATLSDYFNKPIYDGGLAFVTEAPFQSNAEFISAEWKKLCDDSNGDGEINLQVTTAQLDVNNKYTMDPTMAQADITKFMGNLALMGNMLYVVDDVGYSALIETEVLLRDLSDLVDSDNLTQENDRYPIKGTNLAEMVGIGNVLDDLYLCLIDYDQFPDKRKQDEEINKIWEDDFNFFKKLVANS